LQAISGAIEIVQPLHGGHHLVSSKRLESLGGHTLNGDLQCPLGLRHVRSQPADACLLPCDRTKQDQNDQCEERIPGSKAAIG
jgi:hypothetical protein